MIGAISIGPKATPPVNSSGLPKTSSQTSDLASAHINQAQAAAESVRSGPPRTVDSEALTAAMKLAMARQEAERDTVNLHFSGEARRENGDTVKVEGGPLGIRHTVTSPDGSTRQTDLGPKEVRLTETAPDGSSTIYCEDENGSISIEERDGQGNITRSSRYGGGEGDQPVNQGPGA